MGAVKEHFINNCPYREKFDDYGRTRTTNTIHKTGVVVASEHSKTSAWLSSQNAHAKEGLGRSTKGSLC